MPRGVRRERGYFFEMRNSETWTAIYKGRLKDGGKHVVGGYLGHDYGNGRVTVEVMSVIEMTDSELETWKRLHPYRYKRFLNDYRREGADQSE